MLQVYLPNCNNLGYNVCYSCIVNGVQKSLQYHYMYLSPFFLHFQVYMLSEIYFTCTCVINLCSLHVYHM